MPLDQSADYLPDGRQRTDTELQDPPAVALGTVGVLNSADVRVNPSTEDTALLIEATLNSIEGILNGISNNQVIGTATPFSGTAVAAPTTHNFGGSSKSVLVENKSIGGTLDFSLDSGTTWMEVSRRGVLGGPWEATSVQVRRGGTVDVDYQVIATI